MIIFTDLDGTLLNSAQTFNQKDIEILEELGKKNICRVVATGRNIYSLKKVMNSNFPVDFVIFSTGSGIINWKTNEIIYKNRLDNIKSKNIAKILIENNICFAAHKIIPDDHFYFSFDSGSNSDFTERNNKYLDFITEINNHNSVVNISRFIAILSENENEFDFMKKEIYRNIDKIKIIRASSPLNGKNIWLEVYPENVSKGMAAKFLCDYLNIDYIKTVGIGNDYNDIDLLDFTAESYLVENSPEILKSKYKVTKSNDDNGFSEVAINYL